MSSIKLYILHENADWLPPFRQAIERLSIPYEEWDLSHGGALDVSVPPPHGVFYNRVSPSSHTRGHRWAPEYTHAILEWLELYGRRVVNGSRALGYELSKIRQGAALARYGIPTPRTVAVVGSGASLVKNAVKAAQEAFPFNEPFITKHNRAGKGLGVKLFHSVFALQQHLSSLGSTDTNKGDGDTINVEQPLDGTTLLQQYIKSPSNHIIRAEFVDKQFVYAVRVDTSGGFELCPADTCELQTEVCPAPSSAQAARAQLDATERTADGDEVAVHQIREGSLYGKGEAAKFVILPDFSHPLIPRLERFLQQEGIDIAGIEFITDADGNYYVYDINSNTNYNIEAEHVAYGDLHATLNIARYFQRQLALVQAERKEEAEEEERSYAHAYKYNTVTLVQGDDDDDDDDDGDGNEEISGDRSRARYSSTSSAGHLGDSITSAWPSHQGVQDIHEQEGIALHA